MGSRPSVHEQKKPVVTAGGEVSKNYFKYKNYSIYRDLELGSGSFGFVCKGFDEDKKRFVAAKCILHPRGNFSEDEVKALMNLTEHDNIVRIYDTFMHDGGRYIIMQLCDGHSLDEYMGLKNPPLPVRLEIILQIIETLQFMHFASKPTAHRDLKPANIMIVHGSHVKLCDFGLAKLKDADDSTNVGTFAGTWIYMSPEIHSGKKYNPFQADVFSAGLVFLAIVTFTVGEKMHHVFLSGSGMGYDMVHSNKNVLQKRLDRLDYPCGQTTALIRLISRMVKFTPAQRPDFNEIFTIFMNDVMQARPSGSVPTSLSPITHHQLSFKAHWIAAFSSDGSIVLAFESDRQHLYLYSHSDGRYAQVWRKPSPSGLVYFCSKAANSTEIALQGGDSRLTHHYRHTFEQHRTSQHEGRLLDLSDDGLAWYARRMSGRGGWVIDVYKDNERRVLTLQPPTGCTWEGGMSVCSLQDGFAVVEVMSMSLTVFNDKGQVISRGELPTRPSTTKAITTCGDHHLAVACCDPPSISVYTQDAKAVLTISAEVLQLPRSVKHLHGIRYCPKTGILHVAACSDPMTISSLHAYKVEFSGSS